MKKLQRQTFVLLGLISLLFLDIINLQSVEAERVRYRHGGRTGNLGNGKIPSATRSRCRHRHGQGDIKCHGKNSDNNMHPGPSPSPGQPSHLFNGTGSETDRNNGNGSHAPTSTGSENRQEGGPPGPRGHRYVHNNGLGLWKGYLGEGHNFTTKATPTSTTTTPTTTTTTTPTTTTTTTTTTPTTTTTTTPKTTTTTESEYEYIVDFKNNYA